MKAQVLHSYDPEMKQDVWVKEEEVPNPKLERHLTSLLKLVQQASAEQIYMSSKVSGDISRTLMINFYHV